MARLAKAEEAGIYAAAQQWVDAALRSDDSLFTPGEPVWSLETIDEFLQRVDSESVGQGTFIGRHEQSLASASPTTVQLAAEILYVHFLINSAIGGPAKRDQIMKVLGWARRDAPLQQNLDSALDGGVCNPGLHFGTRRHLQLRQIATLAKNFKRQSEDQRIAAIDDPWKFKQAAWIESESQTYVQTSAILHLVFPDTFERVLPKYHKADIVQAFVDYQHETSDDLDRSLLAIRERLSEIYGKDLDFYDDHIWPQWDSKVSADTSKWGQFIRWARRFVEYPEFDQDERDYKLEIAGNLQEARAAVEAESDDWFETLKRAFGRRNNLVHPIQISRFLAWCGEHGSEARPALVELWSGQHGIEEAMRSFLNGVPVDVISGPGTRANLASFLAMTIDPCIYPPYQARAFTDGYKLTGHPPPDDGADAAATYRHALEFLDTLSKEASARGLTLRDRLDAQSALWSVASKGDWFTKAIPEHEQDAFRRYRDGEVGTPPLLPPEPEPRTLKDLAAELFWDIRHLEEIERLLEDKRQVVFYGPPGTGKTYVAQKLADYFAGEHGSTRLVQFHPSYAYEDFVEGYRPTEAGGFSLRGGPLKRIAQQAAKTPDARHVLVIDEINRGNLAKVFGELYFLLEYRNRQISLQYSDDQFKLPENLWVVATMNTADRSIALVDAALRRRFYFVPFFPDEPPIKGLLDRWLRAKEKPEMLWVAEVVDAANRILDELDKRDMAIGPSHFMRDDLDDEWVKRIWKHSIMPYVEEQLFGETERVKEFELDKLRSKVKPPAGGEAAGASEPQGD